MCDGFIPDFGWACSHNVQTVVAHIKDLLSRKPHLVQCYQKRRRSAPKGEGRVVGSVAVHANVWWLSTWRHDELGIPIAFAPYGREPQLLLARKSRRAVVVSHLEEPGTSNVIAPGVEIEETAIAAKIGRAHV